jgi:hypothetical protein
MAGHRRDRRSNSNWQKIKVSSALVLALWPIQTIQSCIQLMSRSSPPCGFGRLRGAGAVNLSVTESPAIVSSGHPPHEGPTAPVSVLRNNGTGASHFSRQKL